jgi:hypothetical protein
MDYLINFWDIAFETPLYKLGLLENRPKRFVVLTGLCTAVLFSLKPDSMFYKGKPRPWSALTVGGSDEGSIATPVPWWLFSTMFAGLSILFV